MTQFYAVQLKNLLYVLLLGALTIKQALACMPHTPDDVFIARFQSSQAMQDDRTIFSVQLRADQFIFRSWIDQFRYAKPKQWQSEFSSQNIAKDSLIIGLAYTPDGAKPEQYQIASFAMLSCQNDRLSISKPVTSFFAWDRNRSSCEYTDGKTIGILDGFIQYDQNDYLKKLQQKYPNCQQLNVAFPKAVVNDTQQNIQQLSGFLHWWNKLLNSFKSWF